MENTAGADIQDLELPSGFKSWEIHIFLGDSAKLSQGK
jgi:hypothetical protein